MTPEDRELEDRIAREAMVWTITESYEGKCDIWVNQKGSQITRITAGYQDNNYIFGRSAEDD